MGIVKNQVIEIDITGITHDGSGVGRFEGMAVFTPGCAQGDRIRAGIISVKKDYAFGRLLEILKPSQARIEIDCPVFFKCGGCAFRHIDYKEELKLKYNMVRDTLAKIAHIDILPEPIVGSQIVNGYRNKAQYPVGYDGGEVNIGFYAPRSHRIVAAQGCLLQPPVFLDVIEAFKGWIEKAGITIYDEQSGKGLLRHIFIRQAQATGELMACAVINGGALPEQELLVGLLRRAAAQLTSVVYNINRENTNVIMGQRCVTVWGSERITDILGGKRFEISPLSFYQVNSRQAEGLYAAAAEFAGLDGGGLLLDLYCGAGTIGLFMADRAARVIGVEAVPAAVEDARRNAALNSIDNAEFICGNAQEASVRLAAQGLKPYVVVVDPPRKGLSAGTINAVAAMSPQRIVYVSCDPATLARDLAIFEQRGYRCMRVKPFDMFPRTAHVECCALLERV
jgi:23S rRNA (uracil1939-C5)-methyltransferase